METHLRNLKQKLSKLLSIWTTVPIYLYCFIPTQNLEFKPQLAFFLFFLLCTNVLSWKEAFYLEKKPMGFVWVCLLFKANFYKFKAGLQFELGFISRSVAAQYIIFGGTLNILAGLSYCGFERMFSLPNEFGRGKNLWMRTLSDCDRHVCASCGPIFMFIFSPIAWGALY